MDIFVGSLPFKIKERELRELFEKFGEVESAIYVIDKRTGQNKGYGFVVMPDEQQALNAIAGLNGTEVMGRIIVVKKSEGDKEGKARKSNTRGKRADSKEGIWKRKLFPKKKKINVIDKHTDDPNEKKKKRGGVKLAKNFKVGKRKKR